MPDSERVRQRLAALSGGLTGLALAVGLWGPDAVALRQANVPSYFVLALAGAACLLLLGILAGWLAARLSHTLLGALAWLMAAIAAMVVAGHLPFEGASLLAWLTDRRFWGLPVYPFDDPAQARLVIGCLFSALALVALGLAQDYRLEGIQGSLERGRMGARSWLLLVLPLALVFGAGLAANSILNAPLAVPLAQVADVLQATSGYTGDLDALGRQTGQNDAAVAGVRGQLAGAYHLGLGEMDLGDEQTVVVAASFDSGAWLHCRVLLNRVSFCSDAQAAYAQGMRLLLAGQDVSQCQDCQMQAGAEWQAWLRDRGSRLGTPQITRLGEQGSYVLMRAGNPAGGDALECLFQGNTIVNLVSCQDEVVSRGS